MRVSYIVSYFYEGKFVVRKMSCKVAAKETIEQHGEGSLSTCVVESNNYGCLPAEVEHTVRHEVYENKGWKDIFIHGG